MELIINQLGFRNHHDRKCVMAPDVHEAYGVFGDPVYSVFEQNQFSMHKLNAPERPDVVFQDVLRRQHTDMGAWLIGDWSP